MEQEEYTKEAIDWSYIEFVDNQDVLDLIEKVISDQYHIFVWSLNWDSEMTMQSKYFIFLTQKEKFPSAEAWWNCGSP